MSLALASMAMSSANAAPATIASVALGRDKFITVETSGARYLRSTDAGLTWRSDPQHQYAWDHFDHGLELQLTRKADFPAIVATGVAPAPGPQTLLGTMRYACFANQLYLSRNAGRNWLQLHLPMGSFRCDALVADGTYLYVANSSGILRTGLGKDDIEPDWTVLHGPGPMLTDALLADHQGTIYANMRDSEQRCSSYLSTDQGNSWKRVTFPSADGADDACGVVGIVGDVVFGRSGARLYSSANQGRDWQSAGDGLPMQSSPPHTPVVIEQVLGGADGVQYAYSRRALFKRQNAASAWQRLPLTLTP